MLRRLKNENKNVREKVRENLVPKVFEVLGFWPAQAALGKLCFLQFGTW